MTTGVLEIRQLVWQSVTAGMSVEDVPASGADLRSRLLVSFFRVSASLEVVSRGTHPIVHKAFNTKL